MMEAATTNRLSNLHQCLRDHQFWSKKAELADNIKLSEKKGCLPVSWFQTKQSESNMPLGKEVWVGSECSPFTFSLKNGFAAQYWYSFLRAEYQNNSLFWISISRPLLYFQCHLRWSILVVFLCHAIHYQSFNVFSSLFFLINRICFSLGSALEVSLGKLKLPVP